jgi:hypothetical protein
MTNDLDRLKEILPLGQEFIDLNFTPATSQQGRGDTLGADKVKSTTPRNKYGNKPTLADGHLYDSGKQAADATKFKAAVRNGNFAAYFPDVRFNLPGGIVIEVDHVVINRDLTVYLYDTKAWDKKTGKFRITRDSRNKMKLFRATFGKEIEII